MVATMTIELSQREISVGDLERVAVDYTEWLDAGELLSTVVATEVDSADLTIDDEAVSAAVYRILDRSVAVGKAALFSVEVPDDAAAETKYRILVTVTTDAGREINRVVRLLVK